jgi:hypothetical protein
MRGTHCHHCEGSGFGDWITGAWNKVTNEFTNPNSVLRSGISDAASKVANEFTNPDSLLRGTYLPEATDVIQKVTPMLQEIPGLGEVADVVDGVATGLNYAQKANDTAKMLGFGKKHRPVKPRIASQHTKSRNEVVKKVMAERGLKMIDASKYVKANNLWVRS